MAWAKESRQELVIMSLNFEKAYDKVSWSFLQTAMEAIGFHINRSHGFCSLQKCTSLDNGEQILWLSNGVK